MLLCFTQIDRPLQKHGGRLDHSEAYCGTCYGAETSDDQCCNSCEEVREAYRKKGWALTNPDMIDQSIISNYYNSDKMQSTVETRRIIWDVSVFHQSEHIT
ncbi:hypothetical protein BHE74_00042507 [Ensete ventricosum]|nr:hypothetical protein BHE74_00042507 [Ensete ventricosum]